MEERWVFKGFFEILVELLSRFWIVWLCLAGVMIISFLFRRRLGLYGQLYDTGIGIAGVFICFFWLFTAIFADQIATFDPQEVVKYETPRWFFNFGAAFGREWPADVPLFAPLDSLSELGRVIDRGDRVLFKWAQPGVHVNEAPDLVLLLGGDGNSKDVFSRMVFGSQSVLIIAPAATLFAFIVGITLGLPAGYYGGRTDAFLSFLSNLVLAFPVILLFFLLVKPEIQEGWIPTSLAGIFFMFPIVFFTVVFWSRFSYRPALLAVQLAFVFLIGGWVYSSLVFGYDFLSPLTGVSLSLEPGLLNIFVAVIFVSSAGVFRIVRGLSLDIATRDYVAAAQTRGERPWYTMIWEILPNARGPLIVDACLRIGYTTILLGTLGFLGLGLSPDNPDWGTTIKAGSSQIQRIVHEALTPALALMSFVLGLNLLADALREQSLKD